LYGLTETYGPHVTCGFRTAGELEPGARAKLMSRQGVPYPHAVYLRVSTPHERRAGRRRDHERVVMRGNNLMRGYYAIRATAKAFAGGWFHSGDVGVVHPTATSSSATARRHHHLGGEKHLGSEVAH